MKKLIVGLFTATMLSACASTQENPQSQAQATDEAAERTPSTCTGGPKGLKTCNGKTYYVPTHGEIHRKF